MCYTLQSHEKGDKPGNSNQDGLGRGRREGQLPRVGSSVVDAESAALPGQRAGAGLALAVDVQAQGGLGFPVQAVALRL